MKDIPGIVAGRANAALAAGGGALFSGLFALSSDAVLLSGGILGIGLAAAGGVIAQSVQNVKNNAKAIAQNDFGGADVELETKDVTRVFFGLKPSTERIYVNKGGLADARLAPSTLARRQDRFSRLGMIVKPIQFIPDLPESMIQEEITNYVVLRNGKVMTEQVIAPTSLMVWDNAFAQAGGKVTWVQAEAPKGYPGNPQNFAEKAIENIRRFISWE